MSALTKHVIVTHAKGVHKLNDFLIDRVEVNQSEMDKEKRFLEDVDLGMDEFIWALPKIPGRYVGKTPQGMAGRPKRKRRRRPGRESGGDAEEEDEDLDDLVNNMLNSWIKRFTQFCI